MRLDETACDGQVLELVYLARKLREALRLEEVLTSEDIDYVVRTGEYGRGLLFRSIKVGAFFYVPEACADACRQLLTRRGYRAEPPAASQG